MKTTALAWLGGGALWLLAGLIDNGTNEPTWLAADAIIAVAIIGLWRTNLHGLSRSGTIGLTLTALARVVFVVAEVISAVSGNDENALLPIGAIVTALGMTLYGAAVLRARTVTGVARFTPLAVGLYPFLAMFPIVISTGEPSDLAIALWGVPMAMLGLALGQSLAVAPSSQLGRTRV